jgi:hypothetical protein
MLCSWFRGRLKAQQASRGRRRSSGGKNTSHLCRCRLVLLHQTPHVLVPPHAVVVAALLLRLNNQLGFGVQPYRCRRRTAAAGSQLCSRPLAARRLLRRRGLLLSLQHPPAVAC